MWYLYWYLIVTHQTLSTKAVYIDDFAFKYQLMFARRHLVGYTSFMAMQVRLTSISSLPHMQSSWDLWTGHASDYITLTWYFSTTVFELYSYSWVACSWFLNSSTNTNFFVIFVCIPVLVPCAISLRALELRPKQCGQWYKFCLIPAFLSFI